jgi:hypothetical protein
MGLSTSKQKTKVNQTESSTSKPVTPGYLEAPIQNYASGIGSLLKTDPQQFVTPASALQERAFASAGGMGGWKPTLENAAEMARSVGNAPTTTVNLHGYSAPQLGPAGQVEHVGIGGNERAKAESLLSNLDSYMDPYIDRVVQTALANYDRKTGQDAAALAADGARNAAFGGSRFGLREGEFGAVSNMNRAGTEAGLRSDAFRGGAQLSGDDANRRQGVNLFNAGEANLRNRTQAQMDLERLLTNSGATNNFRLAQFGADNDAAQFGATAQNNQALTNAQLAEARMNQLLQAAGLTADIGSAGAASDRADLGLTADLGDVQRQIDAARNNAFPTQLQLAGSLFNAFPYPAVVGQQSNGALKGTTATTSTPGIGQIGAGLLGSALSGWAGGGFKFG